MRLINYDYIHDVFEGMRLGGSYQVKVARYEMSLPHVI
jgi:hypothetical protein